MIVSQRLLLFLVAGIAHTIFLLTCYRYTYHGNERLGSVVENTLSEWTRGVPIQQRTSQKHKQEQGATIKPSNHNPTTVHAVVKSPFDGYHPNRIPGYRWNDSQTYYGYVMRDLVTRICSRQIDSSHILVFSPHARAAAERIIRETQQEQEYGFEVGASVLVNAAKQGHKIVGLSPTSSTNTSHANVPDEWWQHLSKEARPSWFLLALWDAAKMNDAVMHLSLRLLAESTVTYVVLGVGFNPDGTYFGKEAALLLMTRFRYKVQVLSNSHFPKTFSAWTPNALLGPKTIENYFELMLHHANTTQTLVRGYLFATQGLDLAIPSATRYIENVKRVSVDKIEYKQCPLSKAEIHFTPPPMSNQTIHATCTNGAVPANKVWMSHDNLASSEVICAKVRCDGASYATCATRIIPNATKTVNTKQAGGGGESIQHSPTNSSRPNLLLLMIDPISRARFERSLPKTHRLLERLNFTSFSKYTAVGNNSGPNQAALYSGHPLYSRDSIAAHKDGKRIKWLWDTLNDEGYVTFKAEDGCVEKSNMIQSIKPHTHHGEALSRMMCYNFQRPNCVGGKSAAQHLVDHSLDFVCQYSSKNCPWAAFAHFVDSHEDTMTLEGTLDAVLWKALYALYEQQNGCNNVSSNETYWQCNVWNNTMIVLMSDHGIHYGSYLSSPQGLRERAQPILHMHAPATHITKARNRMLQRNKDLWTTPFDVYETILDVLLGRETPEGDGLTLLAPLPDARKECSTTNLIPSSICENVAGSQEPGKGILMPNPPSILSFFADVPEQNKIVLLTFTPTPNPPLFSNGQTCRCATSHQEWFNCSNRPNTTDSETFSIVDCGNHSSFDVHVKPDPLILHRRAIQDAKASGAHLDRPNLLFIEVDSVSFAFADRHFPRTRDLLHRHRIQQSERGFSCKDQLCSAEFPFFSVTGANSIPNQVSAFSGCMVMTGPERCDLLQEKNGTVCTDESSLAHGLFLVNTFRNSQTWCRVGANETSPWIFDIAKKAGYVTLFAEEFCYADSPYVAQNNIYKLEADILPHRMFCRVADERATEEEREGPIWRVGLSDLQDVNIPCIAGNDTIPKTQIALDHIEQMWNAYPETSKFAYLNAMAAHNYKMYSRMATPAEAYDKVLSSFLERFLKRKDVNNTIVIVRSDHGIQGGKNTMDYATQIEALRPWNELIVPQGLSHVSLETLMQNQGRLVTATDLYRTLAETITAKHPDLLPTPSTWTTNILNAPVRVNRTCADAKVPLDYCLFEDQRTFTAPNVGTCNLAETHQDFVCPPLAKHFHDRRAAEVDEALSVYKAEIESNVCPNVGSGHVLPPNQEAEWSKIDKVVAKYPGARVSGGIFIYPFQASLLSSIIRVLGTNVYAQEKRNLTICETGFGSGHSASLFLASSPHSHLHTFDKFDRPYQIPIVEQLNVQFKGRVSHYRGNSCKTVPKVLSTTHEGKQVVQCDFIHGSSLCPRDNIQLVEHAPCGVILTSTAMDSLHDKAVYFGNKAQWTDLAKRGCIRDITCFGEDERELDRNLWFQQDNGPISHKFCLAITTGKCSKMNEVPDSSDETKCESKIARFSKLIALTKICKNSKNRIYCGDSKGKCRFGGKFS